MSIFYNINKKPIINTLELHIETTHFFEAFRSFWHMFIYSQLNICALNKHTRYPNEVAQHGLFENPSTLYDDTNL